MEEIKYTLPSLFNETLWKYGNASAYGFAGEEAFSYNSAAKKIQAATALLESAGMVPGDRVAILSINMPNWAIAYFSITFMGAVAVPILPDFSVTEIVNILNHSEAKAIFISSGLIGRIEGNKPATLKTGIMVEDFSLIFSPVNSLKFISDALPVLRYEVDEEDIASIIYTSGTRLKRSRTLTKMTGSFLCFPSHIPMRILWD
jgi:long-chain acyl-CoA synthetase